MQGDREFMKEPDLKPYRPGLPFRLLREPLFHFFLLGAAVFGLFALVDDTPPPVAANVLEVTEDDARRLVAGFEATWHRPPTVEELDHMIGQLVREEVYVREALALGLDRDDAVIRGRLQTKMEFLTESGAEAVQPDDATLAAHLAAHPERFAGGPIVAFEQVLVDEGAAPGQVSEIRASLNGGSAPAEVARPSLLPPLLPLSPRPVVDGTFGTGFFDALAALPQGEWAGPVTSPFGRHLVRVTERREGTVPSLAAIRDRVQQDWRSTIAAQLREERFAAMRARYAVARPNTAEVLGR